MPDILIRGLNAKVIKQLKDNALRNGRSLQKEAGLILTQAADVGRAELPQLFDRWDARFKGRTFSSSVELIREDRLR